VLAQPLDHGRLIAVADAAHVLVIAEHARAELHDASVDRLGLDARELRDGTVLLDDAAFLERGIVREQGAAIRACRGLQRPVRA
jgi:hypothetical protein